MESLEQAMSKIHPATLAGALTYLAVMLVVGVAGSLAIRSAAGRALRQDWADKMAITFLKPVALVALWGALLLAYMHLIPVLRAMGTAMLAGASVASIVLGLAAQNTLGNAIAGLALLVYRPFSVGDRLLVAAPGGGQESGVVESVSVGYTVIRTFDNRRVVLPNALVGSQTTINLSSVDASVMSSIDVQISYTSDVERAREILLDIARTHRDVMNTGDCPVVALGDSGVTLRLRAWCHDSLAAQRLHYDVLERAKDRFASEQIEIPYPYRNVVLKGQDGVTEGAR